MKVNYTTSNGRVSVELDGKNQVDVFEQLGDFQEVFENLTCTRNGKSSDKVKFQTREVEGNKYHELVCTDLDPDLRGARLTFGQHKVGGTLFPKRKDKDGGWLPNNGWVKYNAATQKEE